MQNDRGLPQVIGVILVLNKKGWSTHVFQPFWEIGNWYTSRAPVPIA